MHGIERLPKVLIADDAPEIAERLASLARELGLEVLGPTADGGDALRLFRQYEPDIAILDLRMHGLSGLDVIRAMRAASAYVLIIVLTVIVDMEIEAQCLAAGADHFLRKDKDYNVISSILAAFPGRHPDD